MADSWDFYFSRVNDALSSIAVNMGLRAAAPDPTHPQLLWVWVPMRSPRSDGLSSSDEAPALDRLEDALTAKLGSELGAVSVGRITGDSRREFYFYAAGDGPLEKLVAAVLENESGYTAECGQQPDPTWSQYLNLLYPSPRDQERMRNRRVIEALASNGDQGAIDRPIDHWAYFASESDRDEAASRLKRAGFSVNERSSDSAAGVRSHGLQFQHRGPAAQESVDQASFRILDALSGLDAEYDGWESPVMKVPPTSGLWSKLFSRAT
jgi:hypothetical protein